MGSPAAVAAALCVAGRLTVGGSRGGEAADSEDAGAPAAAVVGAPCQDGGDGAPLATRGREGGGPPRVRGPPLATAAAAIGRLHLVVCARPRGLVAGAVGGVPVGSPREVCSHTTLLQYPRGQASPRFSCSVPPALRVVTTTVKSKTVHALVCVRRLRSLHWYYQAAPHPGTGGG